MKIYIVNFNGQDNYAAYTSEEKAKQALLDAYCEEIPEEIRLKYVEEDELTLKSGYITDYGWITETDLYDANGNEVNI